LRLCAWPLSSSPSLFHGEGIRASERARNSADNGLPQLSPTIALLPVRQLTPRFHLEAGKQEDADHAAGMAAFRADRFSDAEDRLAMSGIAKRRGGIAEAGGNGRRLLEQIEDVGAIRRVVAVHQAEEPTFRCA